MVLDIQDPKTRRIREQGYPEKEPEPKRTDYFGNEIYPGDELIVIDDYEFLKDELTYQTVVVLRALGAEEITA